MELDKQLTIYICRCGGIGRRDTINAQIAQRQEANGLEPLQCGFESLFEHHKSNIGQ